ncbi:MAG: heme-binding protein [Actinomycetes bacterium]
MTEQQVYERIDVKQGFEVRKYAAHVLAEVTMVGPFERAGNAGFGPLVSYISGRNRSGTKVAMTAPVIQEPLDDPMTYHVSFVMPAGSTIDQLPIPAGNGVTLVEVPSLIAAVSRYSGRWSEDSYNKHVNKLLTDIEAAGYTVMGKPRFARFDPPWKPSFIRRNEVVVPIA